MSNYAEFNRQWKKMQAYINTLKTATNVYSYGATKEKISSKFNKMEKIYHTLTPANRNKADPNMKKAQKIMYG